MAGAPSRASSVAKVGPELCTDDGDTAAVRCCDNTGGGYTKFDGDCFDGKTYVEAVAVCSVQGYRLCSKDEIDQTKGSGCGFDDRRSWTSSTAAGAV